MEGSSIWRDEAYHLNVLDFMVKASQIEEGATHGFLKARGHRGHFVV